jgi:hypothetical protein
METPEGEIIDGPYSKKKEFDRVLALYIKQYKYTPVAVEREVDADTFIQSERYDERGYQTGRKGGGGSCGTDLAAQQGTTGPCP